MFNLERQQKIFEYLKQNKKASVEELAKEFFSSESTIRRALTEMERKGQIQRTHGGAIYTENTNEVSILVRKNVNSSQKTIIAKYVANHLPEFNTIFIDDSSTCLSIVRFADLKHKTIFTTSIQIATELSNRNQGNIVLMGGNVDLTFLFISGGLTIRNIEAFHYDLCLMSCAGLDCNGAYEKSSISADIKLAALNNSQSSILVFDKTKIDQPQMCRTYPLYKFTTLFTDANENEYKTLIREETPINIISTTAIS